MTFFKPSFIVETEIGSIKVNKTTRFGNDRYHLWLAADIAVWIPIIGKVQHTICISTPFGEGEKIKTFEKAIDKCKTRVTLQLSDLGIVLPDNHPVIYCVEWEEMWSGTWAEYTAEIIHKNNQ